MTELDECVEAARAELPQQVERISDLEVNQNRTRHLFIQLNPQEIIH